MYFIIFYFLIILFLHRKLMIQIQYNTIQKSKWFSSLSYKFSLHQTNLSIYFTTFLIAFLISLLYYFPDDPYNIITLNQTMSFIYSYFPSYPIIPFDMCSFISHQHHQLQPTTILISNFQISSESLPKNDYLNQIIPITAPSFDQLSTS